MNLVRKDLNLKKGINSDNFISNQKPERRRPKTFRDYQNPIDLLKNLVIQKKKIQI